MSMPQSIENEQFASLYSKVHLPLLRYVMTLVPNRAQAEDIVQDTAQLLWKKFDQYDPVQPFWPWARKFAYFEVLKYRKKCAIRHKYFSDELVEVLADERTGQEDILEAGRDALDGCFAKLDDKAKQLMMDRYGKEVTLMELAERQGKTANSLYLAMHRIRQKLVECVNKSLRSAGWAS